MPELSLNRTEFAADRTVSQWEHWTVHELASVDSTNLVVAALPAWHAVRAETQTAGRGRFDRAWISDKGGLWLSAVVPLPSSASAKDGLPLVAGLAVCDALSELGLTQFRMRWPNDVLVRGRKLAGLLLDQFAPDRLVVGIGINVNNQPETHDQSLKNQTTRLADLLPSGPPIPALARNILHHLHRVFLEFHHAGFSVLLPRINGLWGPPRRVELTLDNSPVSGVFTSVDQRGYLLLEKDAGLVSAYNPSEVRHLLEIE